MVTVPALRFKEFEGEWKKYRVSDLLEFFSTNSLSWDQLEYELNGIRNLHYGLIHKGLPTTVDASSYKLPIIKTESLPRNYTLCINGDIVFADASEDTNDVAKAIEFINCNDTKIVCGLHTIHGRDKLNITELGFKGYAFLSPVFHDQIRRIAQGTKVYSISQKNFHECCIGVPSKDEQQKIASLLSLIDESISTQHKIIEMLESLIKGLNNHLHEIYGKEVEICLAKIGTTYSGLSSKTAEDFGTGKSYITYLNVYQNDIVDKSLTGNVNIADGELQNKVAYGDALFTLSSETPYEVGVAAVCLYEPQDTYLNSFCFGYRLQNRDILTPEYMPYCFSSSKFRKFILPFAQGSTRYNLQKTDFLNASFTIPKISKQRHIANLLYSISLKIKNEKDILIKYQKQKEYLLRNVFI